VLDHVLELLESPNPDTRGRTCRLVGRLASHKPTAPAILNLKPSLKLVSLLRDPDVTTRDNAIFALDAISQWPDGVAALADIAGDVLERLEELSHDQSLDVESQVQARKILDNIAQHKAGNAYSVRDGFGLREGQYTARDNPVFGASQLRPSPGRHFSALISPTKVPRRFVDRGPNPIYHYDPEAPAVAIAKSIVRPAQDDFKNFSAALGARFEQKGWAVDGPNELAPAKKKGEKKKAGAKGPLIRESLAGKI